MSIITVIIIIIIIIIVISRSQGRELAREGRRDPGRGAPVARLRTAGTHIGISILLYYYIII